MIPSHRHRVSAALLQTTSPPPTTNRGNLIPHPTRLLHSLLLSSQQLRLSLKHSNLSATGCVFPSSANILVNLLIDIVVVASYSLSCSPPASSPSSSRLRMPSWGRAGAGRSDHHHPADRVLRPWSLSVRWESIQIPSQCVASLLN